MNETKNDKTMKIADFKDEARKVCARLMNAANEVDKTVETLRRLLHTDGVEVSQWSVYGGKIYITFYSDVEIEHAPESEQYVARALRAMFPYCHINGSTVKIESSELI